jgi:hypothetical protein
MMNLRMLSLLSLATLLMSPLMARDSLLSIPVQEGRVFLATAEGEIYSEPIHDEPFHGEIVQGPIYVESAPEPLFTNVKYVDKREMHPCAVPKIIRVNDPCECKSGCGPKCVYIEICVPPCDCEEDIRCRRDGDRLRYDYGKYKVDIRVRKGFIVVDYQK